MRSPLEVCQAAVLRAAGDAGLECEVEEAPGYPGCELILEVAGPAQAKVLVLMDRHGSSVRFTVRAFMFRTYDKRISISGREEFGERRFPLDRISRDWLRHAIALAANSAREMCEPEHQEKLRKAEVKALRKRS